MVSYFDGQVTDILPENIAKKPEVQALSYALQQGCRLLYKYSQRLYIYSDLDAQPEEVIDLMAAELRTQYYGVNLDIEKKKQLVRNTLNWYMTAGTPEAIEGLLLTVFGWGRIEEWFEYNGRPFYFRPVIGIEAGQEEVNIFLKYLKLVKNARSWLDAIVYSGIIDHKDLEKIVLKNILTRVTIPFWGGFVFNGSWLFDGSQVFGKARRYGLGIFVIHGIKIISNQDKNLYIRYKLHIKLSGKCRALFTSHYSARGLDYSAVVTQRHRFKITSSRKISLPCVRIKSKQYLNTGTEASFTGKVSVPLKSGTEASLQYHMFVNSRKEKAGNFSVETKSKDYWLFDGSVKMDGSRKFNSIYRKETE